MKIYMSNLNEEIVSLRQFFEYPQHMFYIRNKKIKFQAGGLYCHHFLGYIW